MTKTVGKKPWKDEHGALATTENYLRRISKEKRDEDRIEEERENRAKHLAREVQNGSTSFDALELELAADKPLYMDVRRHYLALTAPARREQTRYEDALLNETDTEEMGTERPMSTREKMAAAKRAWWAKRKAAGLPNPRQNRKPKIEKVNKVPLLPHQRPILQEPVQNLLTQAIAKFQSDLDSLRRAEEILRTFSAEQSDGHSPVS